MRFSNFKTGKTLSLANFLSLTNSSLAQVVRQGEYRYISCIEDRFFDSKNLIRCEIGSVSYVLALLCKYMGVRDSYFDELDDGFLSGECSVGEEEFECLADWAKDLENIIIDSSFFAHQDAQMLFEFLNLLNVNVVLADSDISEFNTTGKLDELKELNSFDGSVVYKIKSDQTRLVGGCNFAIVSKIKDGDSVNLSVNELNDSVKFEQDNELKGTVALLFMPKFSGYCFELVRVAKA
ncbi:NADH dehydrogenase [Campylobacter mucosalis]|uniref:hypothetical protein n=1 Tax=Campylobacter mucosalis TaxID=202 RepID=UPI0004DAB91A|nr:hypothetical protein [Campylobacter mucosalis]KEA45785.1 NADH dehydrogenase [Campylobacter mucosalis]QKF62303.1 hypothetical protein CMCT_0134 [Campylobacter mucosalis]